MPTESGDRKVLDNYRQLLDHVTAEPDYNPANPLIAKALWRRIAPLRSTGSGSDRVKQRLESMIPPLACWRHGYYPVAIAPGSVTILPDVRPLGRVTRPLLTRGLLTRALGRQSVRTAIGG
jgi:hypothetical protein